MKLVNVNQMRAIEREADGAGWTYAQMMEKAGLGLAEIVQSFYGYGDALSVTALVGSGNNGGDALVALAALAEAGWTARAYLARPRPGGDDLVARLQAVGGEVIAAEGDRDYAVLDDWLIQSAVLLDGLLGTGIRLPLKPDLAGLLAHVRDSAFLPAVVAVDCPSGVDCDSGEAAAECLDAEVTVSMAAVKEGLLRYPAYSHVGDLQVVDIGLPEGLAAWEAVRCEVVDDQRVSALLAPRASDGHKGSFGTAVIAAGSLNFTGAALLAGRAAARIGTGLVTLAIPAPLHSALAGQLAEATWVLLPHQQGNISAEAAGVLARSLGKADALLLGPGFGQDDCTADFMRRLLEGAGTSPARAAIGFVAAAQSREPAVPALLPALVVDADGLKLLAKVSSWPARLPAESILTPHPGEMSILTGLGRDAIQADRVGTALRFAAEWGHVVVLKGAFTVVAAPDGRAAVIPVATSALAHAGTGDVLAGMIVGLRAQGITAYEAALAGAWMHAQAGLAAASRIGHEASVLAGDLVDSLPEIFAWVWDR